MTLLHHEPLRVFKRIAVLALLLVACKPIAAEETNLNLSTRLDGKDVYVSMSRFAGDDEAGFYNIVVTTHGGDTVWSSPKVRKFGDPWCLPMGPAGAADMQAVGDIDGDGAVELVVQEPQSDVRAPQFRTFRWAHHSFNYVRTGTLVESPAASGHFVWGHGSTGQGTWVATFKTASHGQITALVNKFDTHMQAGEATLAADARGYHVVSWQHKLTPVE